MIVSVVLCPQPPLLFRELGGVADPVADLRAACLASLRSALHLDPELVVVVGPAAAEGKVDASLSPDVRRFGGIGPAAGPGLPLALGVGRRLLDEAGWAGRTELLGIDVDAAGEDLRAVASALVRCPQRLVVLLLGDGSARRDEKGPGLFDERAFAFDEAVVDALRTGDVEALADLDVRVADELLVLGRAAFRLLGEVGRLTPPSTTRTAHVEDPFGVLYVVAIWSWVDD
jgi:hypothetical protein